MVISNNKNKLVEITLHGNVFDGMKTNYKLAVKSVGEAVHAIQVLSKRRFFHNLLENDKKGIKYEVLINGNSFLAEKPITENNIQDIQNSELVTTIYNLETIDIVPVIEGAEDVGLIIAGIVLIIAGVILVATGFGAVFGYALIMGGLGLIATGIINLLSTPPKLEDFQSASRKGSFIFDGPQNTVGEGGPVPIIYGQLIVGSQTIGATYNISDKNAKDIITV